MENKIRIMYKHDGREIIPDGTLFDLSNINHMTDHLQKKYREFTDKINAEKGYMEINLSHSKELQNGIHYECFIMGISKELNDEIEKAIPSNF